MWHAHKVFQQDTMIWSQRKLIEKKKKTAQRYMVAFANVSR